MLAVEHVCRSLADVYVDKLLGFIGGQLEDTAHLQFYMLWCQRLLYLHGPSLKQRSQSIMAILRLLQKNLTRSYQDMRKVYVYRCCSLCVSDDILQYVTQVTFCGWWSLHSCQRLICACLISLLLLSKLFFCKVMRCAQ